MSTVLLLSSAPSHPLFLLLLLPPHPPTHGPPHTLPCSPHCPQWTALYHGSSMRTWHHSATLQWCHLELACSAVHLERGRQRYIHPTTPVLKAGYPGVPCYIHLFLWALVGWVTIPFLVFLKLVCYAHVHCISMYYRFKVTQFMQWLGTAHQ